ncbi:Na+/H+ antiporter subunit E [Dermabacter sp. p3-SID358]|uniref:Na+/H+ antiporter subunit E n=1 Tax=Dermabacter sp. p3-SID358 TaxID=2916114 RepID=UPI0021A62B2F|nr:Na+/H+ antiporter subunit E [Dermabacter sp. p3-SID358]MCT1866334.1 Na+/H+ antiporter subunit E [Dermabacter sp. p3-SID358]
MTRFAHRLRDLPSHILGIIGGALAWCLLWGEFSVLSILGGLLLGAAVYVMFPAPPLSREVTLRPVSALVFLVVFAKDLVAGSIQVARYALRPSGSPGSSVIAVQLRSRSDLFLSFTGILATLIPGSVVVEAQRATGTLFFHAIGVTTKKQIEAQRASILRQEKRLLRAFASRDILESAGYSAKRGRG